MYATQLDSNEIVLYLLQYPVDINQQDYDDGWTALMHALKSNKYCNVEALLQHPHCDVNIQSKVTMDIPSFCININP